MKYLEIKEMDTMSYGSREAMNRLRVNLGYCGDQYKRILVTSSVPDEGKSFVSINLWRMLAEAGSRVVLVDADIRRSVLRSRHQFVTEEHRNAAGLANYLAGQTDVRNVIYSTNIDGAYMVPTFRSIANPSLLLQNPRFGEMMEILSKEYDYVLVDTPPLETVSDGLLVAAHCDGALLVVHSGATSRRLVGSSLKQLQSVNCPVVGTVLNQVETTKSPYYYRYGKYGYYANY